MIAPNTKTTIIQRKRPWRIIAENTRLRVVLDDVMAWTDGDSICQALAMRQGFDRVECDCARVAIDDTQAIAWLVGLHRWCDDNGRQLAICGLGPSVVQRLSALGLQRLLTVAA